MINRNWQCHLDQGEAAAQLHEHSASEANGRQPIGPTSKGQRTSQGARAKPQAERMTERSARSHLYKIKKYRKKILNANNNTKIDIYTNKLNYYERMVGGKQNDSMYPEPVETNIKNYRLRDYIDDPIRIKAVGYAAMRVNSKLVPVEFYRREPSQNEILVRILYCGVCLSDWHSLTGEWTSISFPLIVGYEMTGQIIKISRNSTKFKLGNIVGIGPYINSCRQCPRCKSGLEQYCDNHPTSVYDSRERKPGEIKPTGEKTFGGFSNVITINEDFAYKIPENLSLDAAAPLMDAGLTVYSPLNKYVKPGMTIGISGIGGLGHLAVKIAKAMGNNVVALTTSEWKLADSKRLGADESVLVTNEKELAKYKNKFDFILSTIPKIDDINMYLDLLAFDGIFCIVGYFDDVNLNIDSLGKRRKKLVTSSMGSRKDIVDMLEFCSKHNIVADIEKIPANDIDMTHKRMIDKSIKYRFVVDNTGSFPK